MDQLAVAPAKGHETEKTLVVGIGAHKAGTTWLYAYFHNHPQVMVSPIKELHFFDAETLPDLCGQHARRKLEYLKKIAASLTIEKIRAQPAVLTKLDALVDRLGMAADDSVYLRYFLSRTGNEKVMCEITPAYSLLARDGFRRIANAHSSVKFIFLLRNPIDRFWSHIRYHGRKTPNGDPVAAVRQHLHDPCYVLRTDYKRTLTELFAVVDRSLIHLDFYEDLFRDDAIRRLCSFLAIDFVRGDYGSRANVAPERKLPLEQRKVIFPAFADVYAYVSDLYSGAIPESWKRDIAILS